MEPASVCGHTAPISFSVHLPSVYSFVLLKAVLIYRNQIMRRVDLERMKVLPDDGGIACITQDVSSPGLV